MSTRVSVRHHGDHHGGDEPVVVAVKEATTPDHIAALAREAARLEQARHPGVVAVVEHRVEDGRSELLTRFAGEPLGRWRGSLARLVGLGAAVAATLADLHDVGVVHGRLDASHVLVGDDGRPRLCGFADPDSDTTPPDDVAALARLIADLVEQTQPAQRHGTIVWRRGPLAERRAVEQVLAHGADEVASRRPRARVFAAELLAAVPGAELPPSGELPRRSPAADDLDGDATLESGGDGGPTEPGWPFDEVFGNQIDVVLDEVFADRPWRARRHPPDGPRPGASAPPSRRGRMVAVAALVATVIVVSGVLWTGRRPRSATTSEQAAPPGTPPPASACPADGTAPGPPPNPATDPEVDLDGDGCPDLVHVEGGVVWADGERWAVGEPDDELALGDWDCDGRATPALYRPATGDVFVFPTWATPGDPLTVEAVAQVAGGRGVAASPDPAAGCDLLRVELGGGQWHTVELPAIEPADQAAGSTSDPGRDR